MRINILPIMCAIVTIILCLPVIFLNISDSSLAFPVAVILSIPFLVMGFLWKKISLWVYYGEINTKRTFSFITKNRNQRLMSFCYGYAIFSFPLVGLSLIAGTVFNSEYIGTALKFFICWNAGSALIAWFAPLWSNEHSIFMKEHD